MNRKHRPYSPTPEVLAMGQIQITGNVTPPVWFDKLRTSSGKPNAVAVIILSEIAYWYKPKEVYDEATGKLIGLKSRFKAEKLQRSYQSFSDKFGFTKRQIQDACYFLRDKGLITLEPTTVTLDDGTKLGNVLFIGINPNAVKSLTWDSLPGNEDLPPCPFQRTSLYAQTDEPIRSDVEAVTMKRTTYTEITPEISTKITTTNSPFSPPRDENDSEALVEMEILGAEEKTIATPSTENPKQSPLLDKNSNPGEDKNSARRVATKDKTTCDYQVLVDLYNEYKPPLWRKCQLTSDRERTLKGQFNQLGDKLAQVMIDALKWAESDDFWSGRKGKRTGTGKKFDLDSLFYKNRAQKWSGHLEEDSAEEEFKATHRGYSSMHVDQVHRTLANIADL